jgi:hypothetical protein
VTEGACRKLLKYLWINKQRRLAILGPSPLLLTSLINNWSGASATHLVDSEFSNDSDLTAQKASERAARQKSKS